MSKIQLSQSCDYQGNSCIVLKKKKGYINNVEIYETMAQHGNFGPYIAVHNIPEYAPEDLYDEGDQICLYDPNDFYSNSLLEEKFNEGYEAAISDYKKAIDAFYSKKS